LNTRTQTAYQRVVREMHQLDLERTQEQLSIRRVKTDAEGRLRVTITNRGPYTAHIIYIGVLDQEDETQTFREVDIYIDPSETVTYTSPSLTLTEGKTYLILLITERGNIFEAEATPGLEVSADTIIEITPGGLWAKDRYPSEYLIETGTYVSGTLPGSVQEVDGDYFQVLSELGVSTISYHPSGYSLLGSTTHVSGSISDLEEEDDAYMVFQSYETSQETPYHPDEASPLGWSQRLSGSPSDLRSDDDVYMVFNSYISAASTTTPSRALVAYRSTDGSGALYPKYREFYETWGSQMELPPASANVRSIRVAYCTRLERLQEVMVITLSDDGYLHAYVYNGTKWSYTLLGRVWTTAPATPDRPFDVAYEGSSGRALVVYANTLTDGTRDLSYRIWNGTAWSEEYYIDDLGHSDHVRYRWVLLETNPKAGSNEIGMVAVDGSNSDANAAIWNGSSWGEWQEITSSVSTPYYECAALAYEYTTGYLMAVAGYGDLVAWTRYTGTWSTPSFLDINPGAASNMRWLVMKGQRAEGFNRLMLLSLDEANDACAVVWDGSQWDQSVRLDNRMETYATRCLDGDWEPGEGRFIVVGGDRNIDAISYKIWTPGTGWTPFLENLWYRYWGRTTDQRWVQVRADPRGVGEAMLLIGTVDDGRDLVLTRWDGSSMGGQIEATKSVNTLTYETFEIAFQLYGEPTERTVEVEMRGGSDLDDWNGLTWIVDSACTVPSASVTLQLYDFEAGGYPTSGDGYIHYNSSSTANTDETVNQTITDNPERFRDGAGRWRLKATVVKGSGTPLRFKLDLVEFKPMRPQQACAVELTGSSDAEDWFSLLWRIDSSWSVGEVNVTLQLYDFEAGGYPTSGDGYINYLSSPNPYTDEMKMQNVTSNPEAFRDVDGSWRIRVMGVKDGSTPLQLRLDLVEYQPRESAGYTASTAFIFTDVPTDDPEELRFKLVSDHTLSGVGVVLQLWNYTAGAYASGGVGYLTYTSTEANETRWLNVTERAGDFVEGGRVRFRMTSSHSSQFTQRVNRLKMDYSYSSDELPYDVYKTYVIRVYDGVTGEPRPYASLNIYSNGTTVEFEGLSNPAFIHADEEGVYRLSLKSLTPEGEVFKLYVLVGSVAAERRIVQQPRGG
ncbi:MAG: cell wall-anchored protein, partial [Candidatus Bathyarchaeota archaeon B23]